MDDVDAFYVVRLDIVEQFAQIERLRMQGPAQKPSRWERQQNENCRESRAHGSIAIWPLPNQQKAKWKRPLSQTDLARPMSF